MQDLGLVVVADPIWVEEWEEARGGSSSRGRDPSGESLMSLAIEPGAALAREAVEVNAQAPPILNRDERCPARDLHPMTRHLAAVQLWLAGGRVLRLSRMLRVV